MHQTVKKRHVNEKNPSNIWGNTPLHYAATEGHFEVVTAFLKEEIDISVKDHLGDTPLHLAARQGHLEICKILMGKMAEKRPKNSYGLTPLDKAKNKGHLYIVKYISEN